MCTWRADCLALHTKRETLGMGTGGYGKDSCQMVHGDRGLRELRDVGLCRAT